MSSQKAMINTLMFYHWDNSLFENFVLPAGMNYSLVVDTILLQTSDFPLIITDFNTLKYAIEIWSERRVFIWAKLLATREFEYNPIENYDRTETSTNTLNRRGYGTVKGDGGINETTNVKIKNGEITHEIRGSYNDQNSGNDVNTEGVSAFNDIGFSDHEQSTLTHGLKTTRTYTNYAEVESYGLPDDISNPTESETIRNKNLSGERTDNYFDDTTTINSRIHGNIGVTTTQQMIQQERDIVQFDVINYIVEDYKKEFCILVY